MKKLFFIFHFSLFVAMAMQSQAAVVSRAAPAAAQSANRAQSISAAAGVRMPSQPTIPNSILMVSPQDEKPAPEDANPVADAVSDLPAVEDKSEKFGAVLSSAADDAVGNSGLDDRAESMRRQRAAIDASESNSAAGAAQVAAKSGGVNACDADIRKCMQSQCGNDFIKCGLDDDTTWGLKIESCGRASKCNTDERIAVITEIKQDRDLNLELKLFEEVKTCGIEYNTCITRECGDGFAKCISKSGGDKIIAKCQDVQEKCRNADNGLSARAMSVFGELRTDAEKNVAGWEKRLYELRDKMRDVCNGIGAMFDERSLGCVYTVELWADKKGEQTLFASKKVQPGSKYTCDDNWFGLDITTFKENAYRETASQKGASSAMLGAGLGMAAGALSSGAIGRAMDVAKAKSALGDEAGKATLGSGNSDAGIGALPVASGSTTTTTTTTTTVEVSAEELSAAVINLKKSHDKYCVNTGVGTCAEISSIILKGN